MKICIIGGGTAGWLAALAIKRLSYLPHDITVIESSKIKIIGAGEGTTGIFAKILEKMNIDMAEFLKETKATQKMGINFINWKGDGSDYIAPIDNTPGSEHSMDKILMKIYSENNYKNFHLSTVCGILAEHNLSSIDINKKIFYDVNAYHFDGHLVGKYFKKLVAPSCKEIIDSEYSDCTKDENGFIKSIRLANGKEIEADYFIDCSGFARILTKEVDAGWHSYKKYLTCDTAIPFLTQHKDNDILKPVTKSHALNSGWMWQIPTQDRYGCGYVFDSNFISNEQAIQEVSKVVGEEIQPIKIIKFEPGRLEKTFSKNVVFVGLSGVFLEPLQATSIHGSVMQILYFIEQYLSTNQRIVNDCQNDLTNRIINAMFDGFADLLQIHYKSGRQDTEFWKTQQLLPYRDNVEKIKEICKLRWLLGVDFDYMTRGAGYQVFIYPILHNEWIKKDYIKKLVSNFNIDHKIFQYRDWMNAISRNVISHRELIKDLKDNNIKELEKRDDPIPRTHPSMNLHPLLKNLINY